MTTDGLLVVDKPAGWTSHDVVAKLRGVLHQKRVGHAGTLDPDATGVLLVGLGRATRLLRFLQETTKEYTGVVAFGIATASLDASGTVLVREAMPVHRDEVEAASKQFLGDILQVPPMVSALKVDGRRLYEIAREGKEVERVARPVRIDRFDVEEFEDGPFPRATVRIECSSGTYIRSLAADLGEALGGSAHLAGLRRDRVGSFTLAESHTLERIETEYESLVLTPAEAMRALPAIQVDDEIATAAGHGTVFSETALPIQTDGPFSLIGSDGSLVAVYERVAAGLKPLVVLSVVEGAA
ncbi:MAG: tRNA pseudouridine(55) synthase TruB [Acidimicrobiia bacterium]|nr:tRNA pseudouridine(55) synthase TruB [Acidimicrobiia bacterium]